MIKTLITRISILSQYNAENKTILWEDPANNRWDNIYGQLVVNDNAIFISNDKLLIGTINQINTGKSLLCINIQEVQCQNDQFLRLHAAYPELISRVKASFQPFIHPLQLDINLIIADVKIQNFINFYIISGEEKYNDLFQSFKENDRIVLLNNSNKFENVKLNSKQGLIDFPTELNVNISIKGQSIDEVLQTNKNYKRKTNRSNNVNRIEKIKNDLITSGLFKFTSFFTYYDTLINKSVYDKTEKSDSNIKIIYLDPNETIFKVSMSGKDINDESFTFFNDNNLIIVHSSTKAKGTSYQTQSDTFGKQMKIGDYFYMCRGNSNLEIIGRITSDTISCEYKDFGIHGWMQRSYEIISETIKEESYADGKKWWTPNDNSTCISIPSKEINQANTKLFIPFFNTQFESKKTPIITIHNNKIMSRTLNQILYGPPGTGKTYKLQQIIEDWNLKEQLGTQKDFTSFAKNSTWWKVIALALFETKEITVPDLAKHPLIIAKLGSSNVKSLNTRLWSSLQHHTVDHCKNVKLVKRIGERVFYKGDNSKWRLDDEKTFEEQYISLLDAYTEFKNDTITKNKDYTFTTCHQSLTYEDFIEGIKPDLSKEDFEQEEDEKSEKVVYEIRKGIFYNACEKAAQKAGFINLKECLDKTKEERKELFEKAITENKIHVIFLDEINRCNVSSVFGELITLIEDDKRLGKENEIANITLPYSQEEFGVPANLYIIGTMNTADRSVEALDAALRRRFCFEEMPPRYDLDELQNNIYGYHASAILKTINSRIEKLIDKDHAIGHSYLLNKNENSIVDSFYKNIIPLLQEYFFGDYSKLGLVLGKGFVHLKEWDKGTDTFADFDDDPSNDFDNRNVYEIIDYRKVADYKLILNKVQVDMDFEKAIQVLMNKKIE